MKEKVLVAIKNIFCVLTVLWSLLMLFEYTIILIGVLQISGILYEVFDFCVLFLYIGIFAVPLLFLVSAILIAVVREKYQKKGIGIILNFATIILPIIVGTIMILTDFNSRLQ